MRVGITELVFLGEGYLGDHNPAVARSIIASTLRTLRSGVADRASFHNLDANSELCRSARNQPSPWLRDHSNVFTEKWATALPATVDEFFARRSKKGARQWRRLITKFEEDHPGQVNYRSYRTASAIDEFCRNADKIAAKTYQRGLGVGFADNEENRRRLNIAATKGWLRGYMLFVGEEPVAFWCGRLCNGTMYLDWTGYDPAYRKYEVGTIIFLKMVEDLCASGCNEINYGSGAAYYKERLGAYNSPQVRVSIFAPTLKGVAVGLLTQFETIGNKVAKSVAKKFGIDSRIKRFWRRRLVQSPA
jgi:CelD/BcsL family acetyltransferase involved in cellulose biosynthesis